MEYSRNHQHHRHQQRDDGEEDDRRSFGQPPPRNNFADAPPPPGLYQQQPHFDPYAPSPPAPAPYRSEPHFDPYAPPPPGPGSYRSEPYMEAPAPPPPFGQVSHVGHQSSNEINPPDHHRRYGGNPPPKSSLGSYGDQVSHVGHQSSNEIYPPDQRRYGGNPPPNSSLGSYGDQTGGVAHVSHHTGGVSHVSHHSSNQTGPPSGAHHASGENRLPGNLAGLAGRSTVKVFSKADPDYYLTIRDGKIILAPSDPSDQAQHWYKDEKYSTKVKDAEGFPCFALVNKATGEAVKHSAGAAKPVHLTRYDPDRLDESVLWTQSKDMGEGYRTIRMVNNVRLNVDAYHGDKKSGGVRDGTTIVLWDWNKGDNQLWKIFPF